MGVTAEHYSKVGYVMFQLLWILVALFVMVVGRWAEQWTWIVGLECPS